MKHPAIRGCVLLIVVIAGVVRLPPMPWPNLAHATEADLKAMWAYLQSLKPIKNAVLDNVPPPTPPGK